MILHDAPVWFTPPPPLLLIIITQSLNSVYVCLRNNAEITFSGSQPVYHDLSTRHDSPPLISRSGSGTA